MIKNLRPARPAVAVLLVLAVVAVACGEQEAQLPIEPAGPRPATSTTTTEAAPEEVVVEVPTVTPPTTEPEAVLVAVEAPPATTPPDPEVVVTTQPEAEEGFVVMNTWVDDPTVTAEAPTTTLAPTTTAATTTTTTEVVPVSTIVVVPETTTTVAPPTTTTTTEATTTTTTVVTSTTSTSGVDAPPIPRVGDEGVPEVNEGFSRPVEVDLSWFPERRNVISWEEWNRIDEENTPEWARYDYPGLACPPRQWWSYPLTIQVGTVLANAPRGADCFSSDLPQSYVVTRMWHVPVCETREQRNCIDPERDYAHYGAELWQVMVCGYTFEGEWNDFGTRYEVDAVRLDDGRFRVVTYGLHGQRECNR